MWDLNWIVFFGNFDDDVKLSNLVVWCRSSFFLVFLGRFGFVWNYLRVLKYLVFYLWLDKC